MSNDHLSIDELAELDEGLLPPERISAVRAHLHGCLQCQASADAIRSTRSMLSDLPPVTMPEDVKARLDAAIAAEGSNIEPDSIVDLSSRAPDVVPKAGSVSRPRFGRPSTPGLAVAAVFVLAAGAIIVGHVRHGGSTPTVTNAQDFNTIPRSALIQTGPSAPTDFTTTSSGDIYTPTGLPAAITKLVSGSTSPAPALVPTTSTFAGATPPAEGSGSGTSSTSGTSKGAGGQGGAASHTSGGATTSKQAGHNKKLRGEDNKAPKSGALVNAPTTVATSAAPLTNDSVAVPKALRPLAGSRKKILACAANIAGLNAVPLTVDFARWSGPGFKNVPSAIFVFRAPDPEKLSVWVVNPTCSGDHEVRTFVSVQLPS